MHFFQDPQPAPMPASVGKSLSQIQNVDEVEQLSVKELKTILTANFVDFKGCCEKKELLDRVAALWKSKQQTEGKSEFTVFFSSSLLRTMPECSLLTLMRTYNIVECLNVNLQPSRKFL